MFSSGRFPLFPFLSAAETNQWRDVKKKMEGQKNSVYSKCTATTVCLKTWMKKNELDMSAAVYWLFSRLD